ncbi:HTTM domain-containing protein [Actinoplanes sp. NPDC048796]|uniref:HTTM domain-containing protein n=1 Tax=Actinoplanes sp. NPDC048796 TaxID=3155640 RepID=UPI0033ED2F77
MTRLRAWATSFSPIDRYVQAGRSVLAAAQICNLVFITDDVAFTAAERPAGPCASNWLSIWCADMSVTGGTGLARALSLITLAAVMLGFKARLTCIPHFVVTLSIALAFTVNTGGERVATIVTALLIPICLADDRSWAWAAAPHPRPARREDGAAAAAILTIRIQLAVVYIVASLTKVVTPGWGTGGWIQSVLLDPTFGMPSMILTPLLPLVENHLVMTFIEVGVVAAELIIAAGICGNRRMRLLALMLGLALHSSIGVLMGLPAFSLAMLGSLLVACAGSRQDTRSRVAASQLMSAEEAQ